MKPLKPKTEVPVVPPPALWRPTWKWHLTVLGGIYLLLGIAFFAVDHFLSRLPEPYRLRAVPAEMTPWLKKN